MQLEHEVDPEEFEYLPNEQESHTVKPEVVANCPTSHRLHSDEPVNLEYLPIGQ